MTRLTGRQATNYQGVQSSSPPNFQSYKRAPTPTDWQNFYLGDLWLVDNPVLATNLNVYILVSLRNNIANWALFSAGGGDVTSLRADDGLIALPLAGVINIAGAHGINTTAAIPNTVTVAINNAITLGDLAVLAPNVGALTVQTGDVIITAGDLTLPNTNGAGNQGIIKFGGIRFISNFGTNNQYWGPNAGNTTSNIAADNNIGIGDHVLFNLTTGFENIGIGVIALQNLTTGFQNTCIGGSSGKLINTGSGNTGIGSATLTGVTTATQNTVIGAGAMQFGNGSLNTVIGYQALQNSTTANNNNAIGVLALEVCLTGTFNTCNGGNTLSNLVSGSRNIALGFASGNNYVGSESDNIVIGANILGRVTENNIIRLQTAVATGDRNIFIGQGNGASTYTVGGALNNICLGSQCFGVLSTGTNNIAVGVSTLAGLQSGTSNTAVGSGALPTLISGTTNVAIGIQAGFTYTSTESSNILITNVGVVGDSNTTRIGAGTGTGAGQQNKCFISGIRGITTAINDAVAVLIDSAGQLGTVSSSSRYKDNINPIGEVSSKLYQLNPVQFNYKSYSEDKINYGLIAEEVDLVMPRLVIYDKDEMPETVRYDQLVPLLLNEIIKLNKRIEKLESI